MNNNETTTKKNIYDNCQCLSMENEHMFYCNHKKAHSYLKKGIAEVISEDPLIFRLLFEPKGKGSPTQKPRDNKCIVCGTEEDLTKHHVIPYTFRKLMSPKLKDHRSEEIVPLCEHHHREYETSSRDLTLTLLSKCKEELANRSLAIKSAKASHTLTHFYDHLTDEKKATYKSLLKYLSLEILTDTQILFNKYGEKKIAKMWRKDFMVWIKARGVNNFKFIK